MSLKEVLKTIYDVAKFSLIVYVFHTVFFFRQFLYKSCVDFCLAACYSEGKKSQNCI